MQCKLLACETELEYFNADAMQGLLFFSLFAREICVIREYSSAKTISISDRNRIMFCVFFYMD